MMWPHSRGRPKTQLELSPEERRAFAFGLLEQVKLDLDDDTLARIYHAPKDIHETT